jgi:hypothetical protein
MSQPINTLMTNDLRTLLPIYKYVDDWTLYQVTKSSQPQSHIHLQQSIDKQHQWFKENNMKLIVEKTQ